MNIKAVSIAGLVVLFVCLLGFQQKTASTNPPAKKGMIKVTILYPSADGAKFDMDYYASKHMPLVASLLGDSLKMYEIDKGVAGAAPGTAAPYVAIGYLYFDRLSAYLNSFKDNAEKIRGDIPNYTNIKPIIQISEVVR